MSLYQFDKIQNLVRNAVEGTILIMSSRKRISPENWTKKEDYFLNNLLNFTRALDNGEISNDNLHHTGDIDVSSSVSEEDCDI